METPIFPNASYLLVVAAGAQDVSDLHRACIDLNIRDYHCTGSLAFAQAINQMRRITGVLIFVEAFSPSEIQNLAKISESAGVPLRYVYTQGSSMSTPPEVSFVLPQNGDIALIQQSIGRFLAELSPKGLSQFLIYSMTTVFPSFFKGLDSFTQKDFSRGKHDRQLNFSIVAGDLLGYCAVKLRSQALAEMLLSGDKNSVTAILQEAVNQALGIVVQNLVKIGVDAKVGLPTLFDLTLVPEISPLVFFPSVHVGDVENIICLSLGFVDLSGNELFDLSGVEFGSDSGDVEFL